MSLVGAITTRDFTGFPPAVGQPGYLQRPPVSQGEARVGERRASRPDDAAAQPGCERLLDVRHRRFDYHWIEGDERLRPAGPHRPRRSRAGRLVERAVHHGRPDWGQTAVPAARRFLLSAHASLEELFVVGRLGGAFGVPEEGVAVSWRQRVKKQPAGCRSSGFRRSMRRTSRARGPRFPVHRPRRFGRGGPVGVPRGRRGRKLSRPCTSSIPGRTG